MLTTSDLQKIGNIVDQKLDTKLKPIKKDVGFIKKTVELIVKNYDQADVKLERRVEKIEDHLQI